LNAYSRTKLIVEDRDLRAARLTGAFTVGDVDTFAKTIVTLFPEAAEERSGETIVISRRGGSPGSKTGASRHQAMSE
jgi:ferric-dicitrate binding protein FerR (iron transport regulator)